MRRCATVTFQILVEARMFGPFNKASQHDQRKKKERQTDRQKEGGRQQQQRSFFLALCPPPPLFSFVDQNSIHFASIKRRGSGTRNTSCLPPPPPAPLLNSPIDRCRCHGDRQLRATIFVTSSSSLDAGFASTTYTTTHCK